MEALLGTLMGTGLAISAGFRAFLPMVALGIAGHFIPGFDLPPAWMWLEQEWVIVIMLVLLIIDIVADKVPWVDSINDIIQTVVRPVAGGIAFGASSGATTAIVQDPASFFQTQQWAPIAIGVVLALGTHLLKAGGRAAINTVTGGAAAPVISFVEDGTAGVLAIAAILFPIAVLLILAGMVVVGVLVFRRTRAAQRARGVARTAASADSPPSSLR